MLRNQSVITLAQQNARCWPAKSTWTYNSTAGSSTVTVLASTTPAVGDYVSLAPSGGGFEEQICQVQTVNAGVSFTVLVYGDTTTVTGGAFAGTGELKLFKWTLPAGTMARNDTLVIEGRIACTASAGAKKIHCYLGSGKFSMQGFNNAAVIAGTFRSMVSNRNSTSKQLGWYNDSGQSGSYNLALGVSFPTLTQDTETDLSVIVSVERAATTEDFWLDAVRVVLEPGTF